MAGYELDVLLAEYLAGTITPERMQVLVEDGFDPITGEFTEESEPEFPVLHFPNMPPIRGCSPAIEAKEITMPHGNAARKTTIWLGNDDGNPGGYTGFGFDVTREDDMIRIGATVNDDRGEELEIFILPDLFPKISKIMKSVLAQQKKTMALQRGVSTHDE